MISPQHTRFAQFAVVLAVVIVVPDGFHLIAYCFEFTNESAAIDQSNRVKSGRKHSNYPFIMSENVLTKISNVLYTNQTQTLKIYTHHVRDEHWQKSAQIDINNK